MEGSETVIKRVEITDKAAEMVARLEALHGASRLLQTNRPILYLATHSSQLQRECGEFLRKLGYSVALVPGSNRLELLARPA